MKSKTDLASGREVHACGDAFWSVGIPWTIPVSCCSAELSPRDAGTGDLGTCVTMLSIPTESVCPL